MGVNVMSGNTVCLCAAVSCFSLPLLGLCAEFKRDARPYFSQACGACHCHHWWTGAFSADCCVNDVILSFISHHSHQPGWNNFLEEFVLLRKPAPLDGHLFDGHLFGSLPCLLTLTAQHRLQTNLLRWPPALSDRPKYNVKIQPVLRHHFLASHLRQVWLYTQQYSMFVFGKY